MTTKITLDPRLVREVLGVKGANNGTGEILIKNPTIDEQRYLLEIGARWYENYLVLNIHAFKDLAIEWMVGKGYLIDTRNYAVYGEIQVFNIHEEPLREFVWRRENPDNEQYPNMLSAELAAISFVWEQIQKEKKDEN